jgi:hypothetical protein
MTEQREVDGGYVGFRVWKFGITMDDERVRLRGRVWNEEAWAIGEPTEARCSYKRRHRIEAIPDVDVCRATDRRSARVVVICDGVQRCTVVDVAGLRHSAAVARVSVAARDLGREVYAEVIRTHRLPIPAASCSCGLHAFAALGSWRDDRPEHDGGVLGAVVGWGEMAVHVGWGWRARYARPVALVRDSEAAEQAADLYGLPLVTRDALETVALEFGERMPHAAAE